MDGHEADRIASSLERIEDLLERPDRLARNCRSVVSLAERIYVQQRGIRARPLNADETSQLAAQSLDESYHFHQAARRFLRTNGKLLDEL